MRHVIMVFISLCCSVAWAQQQSPPSQGPNASSKAATQQDPVKTQLVCEELCKAGFGAPLSDDKKLSFVECYLKNYCKGVSLPVAVEHPSTPSPLDILLVGT
jgi:hypothetical protein